MQTLHYQPNATTYIAVCLCFVWLAPFWTQTPGERWESRPCLWRKQWNTLQLALWSFLLTPKKTSTSWRWTHVYRFVGALACLKHPFCSLEMCVFEKRKTISKLWLVGEAFKYCVGQWTALKSRLRTAAVDEHWCLFLLNN